MNFQFFINAIDGQILATFMHMESQINCKRVAVYSRHNGKMFTEFNGRFFSISDWDECFVTSHISYVLDYHRRIFSARHLKFSLLSTRLYSSMMSRCLASEQVTKNVRSIQVTTHMISLTE